MGAEGRGDCGEGRDEVSGIEGSGERRGDGGDERGGGDEVRCVSSGAVTGDVRHCDDGEGCDESLDVEVISEK